MQINGFGIPSDNEKPTAEPWDMTYKGNGTVICYILKFRKVKMKPGVENRNLKSLAMCSTLADWLIENMANMQLREIKK